MNFLQILKHVYKNNDAVMGIKRVIFGWFRIKLSKSFKITENDIISFFYAVKWLYNAYSNNCTIIQYSSTYIHQASYFFQRFSTIMREIFDKEKEQNKVIISQCYVFLFLCRIPPWWWPKNFETCRRCAVWSYIFQYWTAYNPIYFSIELLCSCWTKHC